MRCSPRLLVEITHTSLSPIVHDEILGPRFGRVTRRKQRGQPFHGAAHLVNLLR